MIRHRNTLEPSRQPVQLCGITSTQPARPALTTAPAATPCDVPPSHQRVIFDSGTQTAVNRGPFTAGLASRLVVTGLVCWTLAGTAYAVLRLTFGERPVSIHVRWAPTIDDAVRPQLEQRYRLARPEPRGDRTFGYTLTDRSRDNIRNLVLDPAVEDTHEIDRTAFRVGNTAPRLPYVTPSPGYAGVGAPYVPAALE